MRVYLRMPNRQETPVHLNLVPKAGEHVDYGGERYVVISVVHSVESASTVLDLARVEVESAFHTLQWNEFSRYRTSEIAAYSSPLRSRICAAR